MTSEEFLVYAEIGRLLRRVDKNTAHGKKMLKTLVRKSKYSFLEDVGANIVGDTIFTSLTKLLRKV